LLNMAHRRLLEPRAAPCVPDIKACPNYIPGGSIRINRGALDGVRECNMARKKRHMVEIIPGLIENHIRPNKKFYKI